MLIILWDVKEPTHYSYKSRVIPVLWLSFVYERGVGEVGHLVRDLEVLLCPFPLGNKSCPVKWTKSKKHDTAVIFVRGLEKNVVVSKQVRNTVVVLAFFVQQIGSVTSNKNEQHTLLPKSKINHPSFKFSKYFRLKWAVKSTGFRARPRI